MSISRTKTLILPYKIYVHSDLYMYVLMNASSSIISIKLLTTELGSSVSRVRKMGMIAQTGSRNSSFYLISSKSPLRNIKLTFLSIINSYKQS